MISESEREWRRRYNSSPKGKAARARYMATANGREKQRLSKARSNKKHAAAIRIAGYKRMLRQRGLVDAIKLSRGCADCGYAEHPAALEFDHVAGDKVANVSAMLNATWARIEAEISKCEVVCANCHRIRTVNRARL